MLLGRVVVDFRLPQIYPGLRQRIDPHLTSKRRNVRPTFRDIHKVLSGDPRPFTDRFHLPSLTYLCSGLQTLILCFCVNDKETELSRGSVVINIFSLNFILKSQEFTCKYFDTTFLQVNRVPLTIVKDFYITIVRNTIYEIYTLEIKGVLGASYLS